MMPHESNLDNRSKNDLYSTPEFDAIETENDSRDRRYGNFESL